MIFPLLNEWCSWACIFVESGTFTSRLLIPCIIPYRTDLLTSCSAAISEPSPADATEGEGSRRTGGLFFPENSLTAFNTPKLSRDSASCRHAQLSDHATKTRLQRSWALLALWLVAYIPNLRSSPGAVSSLMQTSLLVKILPISTNLVPRPLFTSKRSSKVQN